MARLALSDFLLAGWFLTVPSAFTQGPKAQRGSRVEFRRLATKPIEGLTQDSGIKTGGAADLRYPYTKPVLTSADVAAAVLKKHDFSKSGLSGEHYSVYFQLTDAARQKLVVEAGDQPSMLLAIFVDGHCWGTAHFRKADAARFTPSAGFFSSQAEAEQVVAACK